MLAHDDSLRATLDPGGTTHADFAVRLVATFTADPLLPPLRFWLTELGTTAQIEIAPYGQLMQSLLDSRSPLSSAGGVTLVLLRVGDWLRELPPEQAGSPHFSRPYLEEMARDLARAIRTHRARAAADTVLLLCPSDVAWDSGEHHLFAEIESELSALTDIPGLEVASARDYHAAYGVRDDDVSDPVRDRIGHIPFTDGYYRTLATVVARLVHRRLVPRRKVVAVDCDNTLWKGVVGEAGPEGIGFEPHHIALHETLGRLAASGVLVCLSSKNEEADVWRVFDTRADLGLRREHVLAAMINWQAKSENLRALAARLNVGLDSLLFIDDNPVECAEVRARCPEVLTLEFPQDPLRGLQLLRHAWELDVAAVTGEDQRRTQMYREEFRRQELREETLTFADFIRNLALDVMIEPLAPADLRRAAQLTLRTNQFNFTTKRRDEAQLRALSAGADHEIRTVRVRDRFGDYGLVGLIVARARHEQLVVDTFLLSCRVLGRGVEHRMAAELAPMAEARGCGSVRLRVERTERNTPAWTFLASIAPAASRGESDRILECEIPVETLAGVRFQPTEPNVTASAAAVSSLPAEGEISVTAPQQPNGAANVGAGARLSFPDAGAYARRREQQIMRAAYELAHSEGIRTAIEGSGPRRSPAVPGDEDLAGLVYGAFSSALGVPASVVREVNELEALGCDSLKIVEVTVVLVNRYPGLPSTLLFEHRSVSDVIEHIDRLARGAREHDDVSAAPCSMPLADRVDRLERLLRDELADALGFDHGDEVAPEKAFSELGMDSLLSVELVERLQSRFGVSCGSLVFEYPSVRALAPRLLERLELPATADLYCPPGMNGNGGSPVEARAAWKKTLAAALPDDRLALLERLLLGEVSLALGIDGSQPVRADCSFSELGMDSLLAVELAGRVQMRMDLREACPIFQHRTVETLARHLLERVQPSAGSPAD